MATSNDNISFTISGLNPQTSISSVSQLQKGVNKDVFDTSQSAMWTHARNAVNNSHSGDYLMLGNEPSNIKVASASYVIIGMIYLYDNIWVVFSTRKTSPQDNTFNQYITGCEIGLFNYNNIYSNSNNLQAYIPIIDDIALNLCQTNPIYGTSRLSYDGEYLIYWDDGLNPTRYLNLGNPERWTWGPRPTPNTMLWCDSNYIPIPYVQTNNAPYRIDIEKLNLIPNVKPIKIRGRQDKNSGGTLPNGLYFAAIAYVLEGNRISDYYISQPIHIHTDNGASGAIEIIIDNIENENVREYKLVIASFVNEQLTAKDMGNYNTTIVRHNYDTIHPTLPDVPLQELPLLTNKYQISDNCVSIGEYLLRLSPHEHFEPNYQPLANLIIPYYVVAEVDDNYYDNSGNMVGYMRDEVYSFFIRWIYKDGNKTPSYIIPAPPHNNFTSHNVNTQGITLLQTVASEMPTNYNNGVLTDDSNVSPILFGNVNTFYSSEVYDDIKLRYNLEDYLLEINTFNSINNTYPSSAFTNDIANAVNRYNSVYGINSSYIHSVVINTGQNATLTLGIAQSLNLANTNIRLVKFPCENDVNNNDLVIHKNNKIRLLGITFTNILRPIDNYGNYIDGIVGYEILRSDRNGNKTIIAKGVINNYGAYNKQFSNNSTVSYNNGLSSLNNADNYLYENYPLNDTRYNNLLMLKKTLSSGNGFLNPSGVSGTALLNDIQIPFPLFNPYSIPLDYVFNPSIPFHSFSQLDANFPMYQHTGFSDKMFSFHSPETTFKRPYLNINTIKLYTTIGGDAETVFLLPEHHPKQKILKKTSELFALLASIGTATIKLNGKRILKSSVVRLTEASTTVYSAIDAATPAEARLLGKITAVVPTMLLNTALSQLESNGGMLGLNSVGTTTLGVINTFNSFKNTFGLLAAMLGGAQYEPPDTQVETTEFNSLPRIQRQYLFLPYFITALSTSLSSMRDLIKGVVSYRDYALHKFTHCYYDDIQIVPSSALIVNDVLKAYYISNHNTVIDSGTNLGTINIMNKNRNRHVFLYLNNSLKGSADYSRYRILDMVSSFCDGYHTDNIKFGNILEWVNFCNNPFNYKFKDGSRIYYTGLLVNNDNVYGRLYENKQLLVGTPQLLNTTNISIPYISTSEILFGGDTYIGRYAEKNAFFYFDDYPNNLPDGVEYNYLLQRSVLYPRYWLSTHINVIESLLPETLGNGSCNYSQQEYIEALTGNNATNLTPYTPNISTPSHSGFFGMVGWLLSNAASGISNTVSGISNFLQELLMPQQPIDTGMWNNILSNVASYDLDGNVLQIPSVGGCIGLTSPASLFGVMRGVWFYLSHIGIRDFWVESEINLAFRMMGDSKSERFYHHIKNSSPHNFIDEDIIRLEDYYKYDWSMSVSKLYSVFGGFGFLQRYDYDPIVADILAGPRLNMLLYSLPQQLDNHKDNWHIFLPLNYKLFTDNIVTVKQIGDSGGLLLFKNKSPLFFNGVDTIETQSNIKITTGDGGLFQQPLRSATNADDMYEYGSMQNKKAVINTPVGLYYLGIDQDKIWEYAGSLREISQRGIKWWLNNYSYFRLLQQFPEYDMLDNTVIGIGALASYDNQNGIVYFHKIDYKLKDQWLYNRERKFEYIKGTGLFNVYQLNVNGWTLVDVVNVHNETYFEDVSWTISYDPKIQAFISFHDWHPNISGGSQDTFFTVKDKSIYMHNMVCDDYCCFYGKYYPFEIEFETNDKLSVSTIRNIEYLLEVYKYENNCYDRYHVLDDNFNEMIVYNTEQCTGLVKLYNKDKNNPLQALQYPKYLPTHVEALYDKEEQKYRINNLVDIVSDRGEFTGNQITIWQTSDNGYVRNLNPQAIDYNKPATERKKMRHYKNRIFLRKIIDRDTRHYKYLFIVAIIKKLYSSR